MSNFSNFPITGEYDVVIVGGGTSGFASAVTAARQGLKTLVLEHNAYLGGTATGGQIGMFMGFANGEDEDNCRGIVKDLLAELKAENATPGVQTIFLCGRKDLDVNVIPYEHEAVIRVMHRMVKASGAKVLLHTHVIGVEKEGSSISTVVFHNLEGVQRVKAKVVIDASFHAQVAADAGVKTVAGDDKGVLQPASLMYEMANVDSEVFDKVPQPERKAIALKGVEAGVLKVNNLLSRPLPNGLRYSNMTRLKVNPMDTANWSEGEMALREQAKAISDYFVNNVPGFEKATMTTTGDFAGLRDSRRIVGCYTLTNEDVLEGRTFPDQIVQSSYPIDVHDANGVDSVIKKPKTGIFFIPYRAMVSQEVDNLIVTGRAISTEYEAHACIRVMITCFRLGEAAGLAASLSIKDDVKTNRLDGSKLKAILLD